MITVNLYLGEALAILCAIIWALAVIFFKKSGETIHPLALNLFKNLLALIFFIPTIYIFKEELFYPASRNIYLLLILSGALGIGIGDTLYFQSLNLLGAGLSSIVVCLYSPFMIILAILFLRERLTGYQLFGAILIITAILVASLELKKKIVIRRQILIGIMYGVIGTLATATSVVTIKPFLNDLPLIWLTSIRLMGGIIVLTMILIFNPARTVIIQSLRLTPNWEYPITGAFLGAYLAMAIWLGGMKYTQISIAAALNQTSTIFIYILAGLILKETVNWRRFLGIIVAFSGVMFVFFG
ncbi:MAG: DMT family transporter [candidate division WOR-3 bacterium]